MINALIGFGIYCFIGLFFMPLFLAISGYFSELNILQLDIDNPADPDFICPLLFWPLVLICIIIFGCFCLLKHIPIFMYTLGIKISKKIKFKFFPTKLHKEVNDYLQDN